MPFINYPLREITCKIVYYGPGMCGKTTNVDYIYTHTRQEARGRMIKLATESERTMFFDFLPIDVGSVRGFTTRLQLYTVPGQVFYYAVRRLILRGTDGVVFVADSQEERREANILSMENLHEDLAEQGLSAEKIPFVVQYNKRDLPGVMPVEMLRADLNALNAPEIEATASKGVGVFETLKRVSKRVLMERLPR